MKNVTVVQKEIDEILKDIAANKKRREGEVGFLKTGAIKKLKARKDYLLVCVAYLNTNPTKEFIEKEKERLLNRSNAIMKKLPQGDSFGDLRSFNKAKRDYEKLMDLPKIRLQLKTLQFIS